MAAAGEQAAHAGPLSYAESTGVMAEAPGGTFSESAGAVATAQHNSNRRRLLKIALVLGGVLAVAAIAGAVLVAVRLAPWLTMPDEPAEAIEARWKTVERLAELPPSKAKEGDDDVLLDSIEAFRGWQPPKEEMPALPLNALSAEQRKALGSFVRWKQQGASYVPPGCGESFSRRERAAVPSFRLAQAALFTAHNARDLQRVEAVLALGKALRGSGRLIDFVIGTELAELSLVWSEKRNVKLPRTFRRYAPTLDDVRGALARDAVCTMKLLGKDDHSLGFRAPKLGAPDRQRPPLGIVRMDRERMVFKQFHGQALSKAVKATSARQIADIYRQQAKSAPPSLLLDISTLSEHTLGKVAKSIEHYDQLAKTAVLPMGPHHRLRGPRQAH